ncbi:MAG TPA: hypothetical protein VI358_20755 [Pseudolabrys sp.]
MGRIHHFLGGTAAAWPTTASSQQGERVRHIGVIMSIGADDSEAFFTMQ